MIFLIREDFHVSPFIGDETFGIAAHDHPACLEGKASFFGLIFGNPNRCDFRNGVDALGHQGHVNGPFFSGYGRSRRFSFRFRRMGQLDAAVDDVADGIDTGHRRFKMFIHLEEAPFHNCLHRKKSLGFRMAAGGNVSILLLQGKQTVIIQTPPHLVLPVFQYLFYDLIHHQCHGCLLC